MRAIRKTAPQLETSLRLAFETMEPPRVAETIHEKPMPTLRINSTNENMPHFLTLTIIEWIDIFTKPQYFHIIIDSLKYCRKNKGLLLFEYVIMTNHIHLIAQAKDGYKLSQIIADFKRHTTKEVLKTLNMDSRKYILNLIKNSFSKKKGCENQIWQRENYPEVITSAKYLLKYTKYIYDNPIKKEYIAKHEDWRYSSALNKILGDNSIIEVDSW